MLVHLSMQLIKMYFIIHFRHYMAVVGTHSFMVVVHHKPMFTMNNLTTRFLINNTIYAVRFIHTDSFNTSWLRHTINVALEVFIVDYIYIVMNFEIGFMFKLV